MLGTKIGMTQIFDDNGIAIPVTVVKAGPCMVIQKKVMNKDGYNAIQIGYDAKSNKSLNKPQLGHLKKIGAPPFRHLREYKFDANSNIEVGEVLSVNLFSVGDTVNISGKTIGKGFTSTQKRHNFAIGPMTHGSKNHRQPGSIGAGTDPGRVIPGKKMPGHSGASQRTIKNLKIIDLDLEKNVMLIKGAIPGKSGNLISIEQNAK
uniref:ribosomal protein L3 n=1 Tax=Erythrolobus coxiae TaxID=362235 RepID=UPI001FCD6B67|nr:ribosomal protein L3 [Erythrolobus coxiae]UNJ17733.1 ribosomal protein L3 [Erythrolobus coxiae]